MTQKLCKDCKHCLPAKDHAVENQLKYAQCAMAPYQSDCALVTGASDELYSCTTERQTCGNCGPDGKNFEAKDLENREPVIPFLKITVEAARRLYESHPNPFELCEGAWRFRSFWRFKASELHGKWSFNTLPEPSTPSWTGL